VNTIEFTPNGAAYTLTTMTPTYSNNGYDTEIYINTIWTLGCNSTGTGTVTDITQTITAMNTYFDNTYFFYSNALPNIYYFVGAQIRASNAYNEFYGPTNTVNKLNTVNIYERPGTIIVLDPVQTIITTGSIISIQCTNYISGTGSTQFTLGFGTETALTINFPGSDPDTGDPIPNGSIYTVPSIYATEYGINYSNVRIEAINYAGGSSDYANFNIIANI
jgi:hypothetical protein